jgi:hypothetical protein
MSIRRNVFRSSLYGSGTCVFMFSTSVLALPVHSVNVNYTDTCNMLIYPGTRCLYRRCRFVGVV